MVLSTAIPRAIAAMMLVPMFSMMSVHPSTPKKSTTGTMFGSIAMNPTLAERNSTDITMKITINATVTLFTWPQTTSSVVPFSRMMLPVGTTGTSGGMCSVAQSPMRATASAISLERSKRVRTRTFACPKSLVMTARNASGFCFTNVSTSLEARRILPEALHRPTGATGRPSSSSTMSPLDRSPLSNRSR